ncbi:hypothetical protein JL720_11910 [Aureococcus anophagefferens]|nr:hypothetical protein JL720_11910 [Aureococcus anophagefferens]
MKFALVALAATASALVAPASLRRPATALAVATAEVPVKSFDGADAGTATLSLKTTKGEKDMRGSTRTPLKPGGGVVFGPKPKDWANKKINRKEAELAIGIAIQNKAARATVVDSLAGKFVGAPKTKSVTSMLSGLGLDADEKTVLVYDTEDDVLEKSAANLPNCELRLQDEITVSDMLWANQVLFTKPAFDWVNERYGA